MSTYQDVFKRYEKKYLLDQTQYRRLSQLLQPRMGRDRFSESTISNIYYDTPDFRLIRASLAKPAYKEKLRLRTYRTPHDDTEAFVEIKKKFAGVVYKRRVGMRYDDALDYLGGASAPEDTQILREIDWFRQFYGDLQPAMCIYYDRLALFERENPALRITFDAGIRWRRETLDLAAGTWGDALLAPEQCLMEVKIPGATPLWLARALSGIGIFPVSFSKYGAAYSQLLQGRPAAERSVFCA